jgi:hypothetical protein
MGRMSINSMAGSMGAYRPTESSNGQFIKPPTAGPYAQSHRPSRGRVRACRGSGRSSSSRRVTQVLIMGPGRLPNLVNQGCCGSKLSISSVRSGSIPRRQMAVNERTGDLAEIQNPFWLNRRLRLLKRSHFGSMAYSPAACCFLLYIGSDIFANRVLGVSRG